MNLPNRWQRRRILKHVLCTNVFAAIMCLCLCLCYCTDASECVCVWVCVGVRVRERARTRGRESVCPKCSLGTHLTSVRIEFQCVLEQPMQTLCATERKRMNWTNPEHRGHSTAKWGERKAKKRERERWKENSDKPKKNVSILLRVFTALNLKLTVNRITNGNQIANCECIPQSKQYTKMWPTFKRDCWAERKKQHTLHEQQQRERERRQGACLTVNAFAFESRRRSRRETEINLQHARERNNQGFLMLFVCWNVKCASCVCN